MATAAKWTKGIRRYRTTLVGQQIPPAVFRGILLIGMAQGLRIPAAFFFKILRSDDGNTAMVSFTALLGILLLLFNLIAVWATLSAAVRGAWLIRRTPFSRDAAHYRGEIWGLALRLATLVLLR